MSSIFIPLKGCNCKICTRNIPTVTPYSPFDAEADANTLRTSVKGLGTDNEEITRILGSRTSAQRHEIEEAYRKLFDRELIEDLKSDLSGHFERLVVSLFYPWPQHVARIIEKALNGFFGSDEKTIIDLLATASNCELKEIKMAYKELYEQTLEEDLKIKLHGDIRSFLLEILKLNRVEDSVADPIRAKDDAKKIQFQVGAVIHAQKEHSKLDKSAVITILSTRGYAQLVALEKEYRNLTAQHLEQVFEEEYSGDFLYALKTTLAVARNKPKFFAERIHKTIARLGTDDRALINLVVLRSEIDLGNIAKEYETLYNVTLSAAVSRDLQELYNAHYKQLILDIIKH